MTVKIEKLVNWYIKHFGKLTYSMTGSRNGDDRTADCSGALTQALFESGAKPYKILHSTVTIGSYLAENDFEYLGTTPTLACKKGDVLLLSWNGNIKQSVMANGHCGILKDAKTFISVDYSSHQGREGRAVAEHPWLSYYEKKNPDALEVWRLRQ